MAARPATNSSQDAGRDGIGNGAGGAGGSKGGVLCAKASMLLRVREGRRGQGGMDEEMQTGRVLLRADVGPALRLVRVVGRVAGCK